MSDVWMYSVASVLLGIVAFMFSRILVCSFLCWCVSSFDIKVMLVSWKEFGTRGGAGGQHDDLLMVLRSHLPTTFLKPVVVANSS